MGGFLSYSILAGFLMIIMFAAYRLLMAKDNQPAFNRLMLLLIYLVSFTSLPVFDQLVGGNIDSISQGISFEGNNILEIDFNKRSRSVWGTIVLWIYISGMVAVSIRTIITWIRISNVISNGKKISRDAQFSQINSRR